MIDSTNSAKVRKTYPQDWTSYNKAQTSEKRLFQVLLGELCDGLGIKEEPRLGAGRPPMSLRDMLFAMNFKVYSTVSARRFNGDLEDAHRKGPSFTSAAF